MDMAGETESMYMIETLNQEFDVVVNENDQLKKEIELLKEKLIESESKKDKVKEYYCQQYGPPSCDNCNDLIYYGEAHSKFTYTGQTDMIYDIEIYCKHCTGDQEHVQAGWTCQLIEEYD